MYTLLIWDRLGDYHRARWQALNQEMQKQQLGKCFTADLGTSDQLYNWQTQTNENPYHYLLSHKPVHQFDLFHRLLKVHQIIQKNRIKVIAIAGYWHLEYIIIMILAKIRGIKVILFAESWYPGNPWLDKAKRMFLKTFVHGFFVSGKKAFYHFQHNLKIPEEKIITGYSVVDNQHFRKTEVLSKDDDNITLLTVARFAPEKNLKLLIKAFQAANLPDTWQLKLVGGGPLQSDLERQSAHNPNIIINSWQPYNELPSLYHQAHFFILPSTFEPWGLVVNEAMAAGLPVIVSQQSGCHPDLVDKINGFTFDANSLQELVDILQMLPSLTSEKVKSMSTHSQTKIQSFTPYTWAQNFLSLVN